MFRHVLCNAVLAASISAVLAIGCEEESDTDKIVLSEVIPDPVPVSLSLTTGTMIFDFTSHPLDLSRKFEMEKVLFTGTFGVTVTDDATGATYDITQGVAIMTPPDEAGEYLVAVSEDGKTVTVSFYYWFQGHTFNAGGDYSATVDVLENDFFETETFVKQVTVL
jgi:hypothetical protein